MKYHILENRACRLELSLEVKGEHRGRANPTSRITPDAINLDVKADTLLDSSLQVESVSYI